MKDLRYFALRIAVMFGLYGLFKIDMIVVEAESRYWSVITFFLASALISGYEKFFEIKGRDETLAKIKDRANRGA